MKLTIIVTAYNENNTILTAIEEVKKLPIDKEIIVVDNCSTDGTREKLKAIDDGSIRVVFQPRNYGYGQSVMTGISLAKGDFAYVQYSDLEYDVNAIPVMLDEAEKNNRDVIFGSRLFNQKRDLFSICQLVKKRPYYLGTLITTFLINAFYNRKYTDIIGTKLYRTKSFKELSICSRGFDFDFEVVSKLCKYNYNISEIPVPYKPRTSKEGKKLKARHIFSALNRLFEIKYFN